MAKPNDAELQGLILNMSKKLGSGPGMDAAGHLSDIQLLVERKAQHEKDLELNEAILDLAKRTFTSFMEDPEKELNQMPFTVAMGFKISAKVKEMKDQIAAIDMDIETKRKKLLGEEEQAEEGHGQ